MCLKCIDTGYNVDGTVCDCGLLLRSNWFMPPVEVARTGDIILPTRSPSVKGQTTIGPQPMPLPVFKKAKKTLARTPIEQRIAQINNILHKQISTMLDQHGYEDGSFNDKPDEGWRKMIEAISYLDTDPRFLASYHDGWKKGNRIYKQNNKEITNA